MTTCPTPDKRGYPCREAAELKLHRIWSQVLGQPRQRRLNQPCRAYECECGQWHLTKTPNRPGVNQP